MLENNHKYQQMNSIKKKVSYKFNLYVHIAIAIVFSNNVIGQELDRTSLPIKEPKRQTYTELDARNTTAPPRFEVKAPKGAPNVVVILIDDMGFGVTETFGGQLLHPI